MNYLIYMFDLIYSIMNSIKIPIPIWIDYVVFISLFDIFIGFCVLGSIIFFITKLLNFEINYAFSDMMKMQKNNFGINSKSDKPVKTNRSGSVKARSGDVRYK